MGLYFFVNATLGIGGGAPALIPVHGFVQFGSNFNHALLTWRQLDRQMILQFMTGAVIGAVIASFTVVQWPLTWIHIAVSEWLPLILLMITLLALRLLWQGVGSF